MFKFFRFLLIIFSLACTVLSVWALIGSYKNESYLTNNYLIDFHLTQLDLSKVLDIEKFNKRNDLADINHVFDQPSATTKRGLISDGLDTLSSGAESIASSVSSTINDDVQAIVSEVASQFKYSDLGLADVYTVSFWGYCKGYAPNDDSKAKKSSDAFDNTKLNITYCTKPKIGYKFDPLQVFKHELNNTIHDTIDGSNSDESLTDTARSYLKTLVNHITYENLDLPGDLKKKLTLLNNLTRAAQALILTAAVLSFVSILIQALGCCLSPHSCCLSFLNFLFEAAIFIIIIVGAGLATGSYMYVRKVVNKHTSDYGVKSFLSVQLYAFVWSAAVAALIVIVLNLLGHCCGLFSTGRKNYRTVAPPPPAMDHEMGYDHKEAESDLSSKH